jgi:hypothetical protein
MSILNKVFRTTRLSIWLLLCALILAATSVYAAGETRPLAAVDIIGSPDAAVDGKFAVGTTTPGNKTLTVAGVIDFVGAGTVHNYFTQGPGNNMQIRSNVDEYNAVGNSSYAQWNMVMGASLDVFSIRRSPASSTYNEDALFWIEGSTGNVGIAKVDTSNGATIPFTLEARLHVETDSGDAIRGVSNATSGTTYGMYGTIENTSGAGVYGYASSSDGLAFGVQGVTDCVYGAGVYGLATGTPTGGEVSMGVQGEVANTNGWGVFGHATSTSGYNIGVIGWSDSTQGSGVKGQATASSGSTVGVSGFSSSTWGYGVLGSVSATSGPTIGVSGQTQSTEGSGVWGYAGATSGTTNGVWGENYSSTGRGVFGYVHATSGLNYAVMGATSSSSGYDFYAAGSGTDYGPFTGAHEVMLVDSFPADFKLGMIVSATGEAKIRENADGSVDLSSTLPTVKLADTAEDIAVLGVVVAEVTLPDDHWYESRDGERFGTVNALGEGRGWVANINGDIQAGDYITTSLIPGYGQRQSDGYLHNYTLAKATEKIDWDTVTETVTFNGQEYKVYLLAVVYTSG